MESRWFVFGDAVFILIGLMLGSAIPAQGQQSRGNQKAIACHGESLIIRCSVREEIKINDAVFQLVDISSSYCRHTNRTSKQCRGQPLRETISDLCAGKDVCELSKNIENVVQSECKASLYLTVWYDCVEQTQFLPANSVITKHPRNVKTTPLKLGGATTPTGGNDSRKERKISAYFQLFYLFLEIRQIPTFIQKNPRKAVLCLVLSLAFGISLMILYMLITACCKRFCKNKNKKRKKNGSTEVASDEADGVKALLISTPTNTTSTLARNSQQQQPVHYETVLVTRQNGVALHETKISSDSTLLSRKGGKKTTQQGHAEIISTIKRTHSIDEGTQTDSEEAMQTASNIERPSRTISVQEAQELGDLVEVLNYYNSRIDDDDAFYPQFSGNHFQGKQKQDKVSSSNNNHDERYYYENRGPSYDDEGRRSSSNASSTTDRLPLLTSGCNVPTQPSPYHTRYNAHSNRLISDNKRSRNPSELSYATSASSNISDLSLGNYSADANYQVDHLRIGSIQRTAKPGVRGDGYEFIVNSSSRSNSSK